MYSRGKNGPYLVQTNIAVQLSEASQGIFHREEIYVYPKSLLTVALTEEGLAGKKSNNLLPR